MQQEMQVRVFLCGSSHGSNSPGLQERYRRLSLSRSEREVILGWPPGYRSVAGQ